MRSTAELMKNSQQYADEGRWDVAYVYANEACILLKAKATISSIQPASSHPIGSHESPFSLAVAEKAVQQALYKLMPAKCCLDRVALLMQRANEQLVAEDYEAVVQLTSKAHSLEHVKTPVPLLLRSRAYYLIHRHDLSYVDASEALVLMSKPSSSALGAQKDALDTLVGYRLRPYGNQDYVNDIGGLVAQMMSSQNAPRYRSDMWPNCVKVTSLQLCWNASSPDPHCLLEKEDGSFVTPVVRFADLPKFFANHTRPDSFLDSIMFNCSANDRVPPPTEDQMRVLMEVHASRKGGHSPFAALNFVRLFGVEFHCVTPATFNRLLPSVLKGKTYQINDLRSLPKDFQSEDFLLHPSLMASSAIRFSMHSLLNKSKGPLSRGVQEAKARLKGLEASADEVVKFPSAAVIAHLKRTGLYKRLPNGDVRTLYLTEAYLADGVTGLVRAIWSDHQQSWSSEKAPPYQLILSFHDYASFDWSLCVEMLSSGGSSLRVAKVKGESAGDGRIVPYSQLPGFDTYQVGVVWSG